MRSAKAKYQNMVTNRNYRSKITLEITFEDNKISEKLTLHHIEKRRKNTYDAVFETNIYKELYDIIEQSSLTILMQACYYMGYFPLQWKK